MKSNNGESRLPAAVLPPSATRTPASTVEVSRKAAILTTGMAQVLPRDIQSKGVRVLIKPTGKDVRVEVLRGGTEKSRVRVNTSRINADRAKAHTANVTTGSAKVPQVHARDAAEAESVASGTARVPRGTARAPIGTARAPRDCGNKEVKASNNYSTANRARVHRKNGVTGSAKVLNILVEAEEDKVEVKGDETTVKEEVKVDNGVKVTINAESKVTVHEGDATGTVIVPKALDQDGVQVTMSVAVRGKVTAPVESHQENRATAPRSTVATGTAKAHLRSLT